MGNWDGSKPNNDGERELIDREVKALEAELATKTCNKQIVSKLENAELARDSEVTCNNKQVISKLVASEDAISRQAVLSKQVYMETEEGWSGFMVDVKHIEELPPVTPKQRTGHWIFDEILDKHYYCSECKSMGVDYWDYCPNCGAKMEEQA